MSKLLDKLLKAGSMGSSLLSESDAFKDLELIQTSVPAINIAFSGQVDGGYGSGVTILAGESKTFKTALALYCMKAYLDKYADGFGILYDTEGGVTTEYIKTFGIDPNRVIHIPIEHVEQLKFDFVKKLESISKGEHVFFMVDSIGQISSKKEVDDAADEKSVADMSRAKAIRSLMRLITVQLAIKKLPCFMINHVYATMELYSRTVIPGGTAVTYSANTILVITKSQEKSSDGDIEGWHFKLNIHKSRLVREKAKVTFSVFYETGISRWSGLLELAMDTGHIIKPSNGWYSRVNTETGEVEDKKFRMKDTESESFWKPLLVDATFKKAVESNFRLAMTPIIQETEIVGEED